jgi:septal ring factor EnvC (AmiA/AmiB activator)
VPQSCEVDRNRGNIKQGNYSLSNDPRDKHRSKELYSKPTPTELKHILSRAGKVVDSLLKKETEQKEQKSEQKEQKSEQKEQKYEQKEQKEQKTTLFMFDE